MNTDVPKKEESSKALTIKNTLLAIICLILLVCVIGEIYLGIWILKHSIDLNATGPDYVPSVRIAADNSTPTPHTERTAPNAEIQYQQGDER